MRLLFKQRFFSWFDSYDIYYEDGSTAYTVQGKLSWGHRLEIYDSNGENVATLNERVLTFLPRFQIYIGDEYRGEIVKELTFFKPSFSIDCNDWSVEGDFWQWDYRIMQGNFTVATIQKELFKWTDTYVIDVQNPDDALLALMVTLAIDAVKCNQN